MAKHGPPKFFENKPKAPTSVPLPSAKKRRSASSGGAGASGGGPSLSRARSVLKPKSPPKGFFARFSEGGESWKTYAVVVVSLLILVGIAVTFVTRSFRSLDMGKAVGQVGLIATTLQTLETELGGFHLDESLVADDQALLNVLRTVAAGGTPVRDAHGRITGATLPAANARPLYVEPIPARSILGPPFRFLHSPDSNAAAQTPREPEGEAGDAASAEASASPPSLTHLPTIEVDHLGSLSPPPPGETRWIFRGDLSHVPRDLDVGGEIVNVTLVKGDGSHTTLDIFKPREVRTEEDETQEPPPQDR